jgi:hypothetical protein
MEVISIFYSSPNDDSISKYQSAFRETAEQVGRLLDVRFDVLYWRDIAGGLGSSPQDVIDRRVKGKYQVYFGVMGGRFGPYTEHEYRVAVEDHLASGLPNYVCFGFCNPKVDQYAIDPVALAELKQFQNDMGAGGKYGLANLYFSFGDKGTFKRRVEVHLKEAVELIRGRVKGGLHFS